MTVRFGDRGAAVRNYQRQLQRQGYRIRADGIFGPKTQAAHQSFQARRNRDTFTPAGPAARRQGRTQPRAPSRPQTPSRPSSRPQTPSQPQAPTRPSNVTPGQRVPGEKPYQQLVRFAQSRGFTVTSTTGGHHLGAGHREGRAADIRTKDHTKAQVDQFIREARAAGYKVIDERGGGNSAWSGPHVHLEIPRGR